MVFAAKGDDAPAIHRTGIGIEERRRADQRQRIGVLGSGGADCPVQRLINHNTTSVRAERSRDTCAPVSRLRSTRTGGGVVSLPW
ncbi:hypothetical protein ACFSTD_05145 [Novosphingobium colocasiae]